MDVCHSKMLSSSWTIPAPSHVNVPHLKQALGIAHLPLKADKPKRQLDLGLLSQLRLL